MTLLAECASRRRSARRSCAISHRESTRSCACELARALRSVFPGRVMADKIAEGTQKAVSRRAFIRSVIAGGAGVASANYHGRSFNYGGIGSAHAHEGGAFQ